MSQNQQVGNGGGDQANKPAGPVPGVTPVAGAGDALQAAAAQTGKVSVVYGANDLELELAGQSVADVQAATSDVLNLDKNAEAYVNGQQVDGNYKLKAGDRLEFMKESGQKGC
jgi:hypothetical protein